MIGLNRWWIFGVVMGLLQTALGADAPRDLHVGGEGPDRYPTLQAAIAAARPGDTVHLDPERGPYRETAVFSGRFGEPGRPIILDGHGATLLGSEPLNPAEWDALGDGLWRSESLARRLKMPRSMLSRFFLVFDGQMQTMGGASKLRMPRFKAPQDLQAGEWSFVAEEPAFYVRIEQDLSLAEARIEVPERAAGVSLRNENKHLIIRNIRAQHVWNDGFNIHGHCEEVLFENIEAIACGDDGISAHSACQIVVDGLVSRGNANGICHVDQARTVHRRVLIQESRAYDLYLLNDSIHTFEQLQIEASAPRGVVLTRNTQVTLDRVQIGHAEQPVPLRIDGGARVFIRDGELWNVQALIRDAEVSLQRTVLGGTFSDWSVRASAVARDIPSSQRE